ncbi:MAG: rhomboid family intramembrane serine protease [Pseudooceanicola sp.]|nr:rhomboid family intramembrane serine protease [Pseudooceanicola sp.]
MTGGQSTAPLAHPWRGMIPVLAVFMVLPILTELALTLADLGVIGTPRLRARAYQYGAFWAGLLDNWRPNYAAQPQTMFVTYSFLHANLWHLTGNMIAFVVLLQLLRNRLWGWRFVLVYAGSAVGGALGFAFLGTALNPMVGSSGALFGLAGAWKWLDWSVIPGRRRRALIAARDVAVLAALNLVMWLTEGGALAWEAHLGGFVAGAALMAALRRAPDQ